MTRAHKRPRNAHSGKTPKSTSNGLVIIVITGELWHCVRLEGGPEWLLIPTQSRPSSPDISNLLFVISFRFLLRASLLDFKANGIRKLSNDDEVKCFGIETAW